MHPHETARLESLLREIGLAHHLEHDERRKNAAAGYNPYSYNDPRYEPMQCEIERVQRVRAARRARQGIRDVQEVAEQADGDETMNVEKNCLACGDLIRVRLADHKRGWGKFCDKACAAAHKCGQRPRDVNAGHAKYSAWAADRMQHFAEYGQPVKAMAIKEQVGKKVKIKPAYHSPNLCRSCGTAINGPGLCAPCDAHEDGLNDRSWDAHSV